MGCLASPRCWRGTRDCPAGEREQAETLERAGRHLLSLANDALDLMRIDAVGWRWRPARST